MYLFQSRFYPIILPNGYITYIVYPEALANDPEPVTVKIEHKTLNCERVYQMMNKKNLLLATCAISLAAPHRELRAELSGGEIAGYVFAGAAALAGVYFLGKECDVWGNPNPHEVYRYSNVLLEQVQRYRPLLDAYANHPGEDLLYTIAIEHTGLSTGLTTLDLQNQSRKIDGCIEYMRRSKHYNTNYALLDQLQQVQYSLDRCTRELKAFEEYLCKHAPYFELFKQEKHCLNSYAQENALYNSYAYQPEYLKNQIYQIAFCRYNHDTYAIIKYIKQLDRDIDALQRKINNGRPYRRATYAQRFLDIMRYIEQLIMQDPAYARTVAEYERYKLEQERLRIERERLEFERMQAAAERARLAREREKSLYATRREREAAEYKAQREREAAAYKAQVECNTAAYKAQTERDTAAYKAQCEREAAASKAQRERETATNNATREREERARQQERKREQERQESAQRRDAERRQRDAEDAERIAKQREQEKKDPYRDYEQQEQERKKRKQQEKAAEEARKQQERKDEQYRYMLFDQFV
jgi:hypothetical protein